MSEQHKHETERGMSNLSELASELIQFDPMINTNRLESKLLEQKRNQRMSLL